MQTPSKQRNFIRQAFEASTGPAMPAAPMDVIDRRIVAELQAAATSYVAALAPTGPLPWDPS